MVRNLFLFTMFFVYANFLIAQERVVHGVIHTLDSIPLIGVEVQAKSTNHIVLSDSTGRFSIVCNMEDRLRIRGKGFYDQNIKVSESIKFVALNMKLKPGRMLPQYAIGYGSISMKEKSNAVEAISYKDQNFSKYLDMYELIQGQFSGVEVSNGEVIIRGGNRTLIGSNAALIVVDGVLSENDILNLLSPINIKSISVIKDGSSAVYGSRGANGVLLIETKKGGEM